MKRILDFFISLLGLILFSPVLLFFIICIWFSDFRNPFYVAPRVGMNRKIFQMVKLRSMIYKADRSGVDSTSSDDKRITWIGRIIRRYKLDELSQLWNVMIGHMSLVGPRPNVESEVNLYTADEMHLLDVRPGVTDLSSIVFSDEGEILKGSDEPDLKYNQVIRPWKSRLGLLYIQKQTSLLDIRIIILTVVAIISKQRALRGINRILQKCDADPKLIKVVQRDVELYPYPPPGSDEIVRNRENILSEK